MEPLTATERGGGGGGRVCVGGELLTSDSRPQSLKFGGFHPLPTFLLRGLLVVPKRPG